MSDSNPNNLEATLKECLAMVNLDFCHEINNPASIVQGFANLLLSTVEKDDRDLEKVTRLCKKIVEANTRVCAVTNLFSELSDGVANDKFRAVKLVDLLHNPYNFLKGRAERKEARFTMEFVPDTEVLLHCKAGELLLVLFLIVNRAVDNAEGEDGKVVSMVVRHTPDQVAIEIEESASLSDSDLENSYSMESLKRIIAENRGQLNFDLGKNSTKYELVFPVS